MSTDNVLDNNAYVVDVETTIKMVANNLSASPYHAANELVMAGSLQVYGDVYHFATNETVAKETALWNNPTFIVGQNLAFDLPWLNRTQFLPSSKWKDITIWDVQLAEYLLTGQQSKMASLDEMSKKYGGTPKNALVAAIFESGKGADAVDKDMLAEYLKDDLKNTRLIFEKQLSLAVEKGMLPLIMSQMDARLATIEMEMNGMHIDIPNLIIGTNTLLKQYTVLRDGLEGEVATRLGKIKNFNILRPSHLSAVLWGGVIKYDERVDDGFYKNGNPRYKTVSVTRDVASLLGTILKADRDTFATSRSGVYETNETALDYLEKLYPGTFIKDVKALKSIEKQLNTYYTRILELTGPDSLLHGKLNHTVTNTGRLSSSSPNLQNITNGAIKRYFTSRWGSKGKMVEVDYAQLEMAVLAAISGDFQLKHDIVHGLDMHTELYKSMYGRTPTKEERKVFKRCSFALVYGAGAHGIAEQGGILKGEARKFIETFYNRYPGVGLFHSDMMDAVEKGREYEGGKNENGTPVGVCHWQSPFSNRVYTFKEYERERTSYSKKSVSFSPQETKNYPIQGGATGDIVPLMVGVLYRVLKNNPRLAEKALLVNTVHDSILLDVHEDVLDEVLSVVPEVLEDARKYIDKTFPWQTWPIDLKVGVSYGTNWLDQTTYERD